MESTCGITDSPSTIVKRPAIQYKGEDMKFILHSVSYSPTWKGQTALPVERVVEKASQLGYDGIELIAKRPHASPLDLNAEQRKIEGSSWQGPRCPIAGIGFLTGLDHPDGPRKRTPVLRETVRLARTSLPHRPHLFRVLRPQIPYETSGTERA
jgi:hypothetical protein